MLTGEHHELVDVTWDWEHLPLDPDRQADLVRTLPWVERLSLLRSRYLSWEVQDQILAGSIHVERRRSKKSLRHLRFSRFLSPAALATFRAEGSAVLFQQERIREDDQLWLLEHGTEADRKELAARPDVTVGVGLLLVESFWYDKELASNWDAPPEVLRAIFKKGRELGAVARNPSTPADVVAELVEVATKRAAPSAPHSQQLNSFDNLRAALSMRADLGFEESVSLCRDGGRRVREAFARNTLWAKIHEELAGEVVEVWENLFRNPHVSQELLFILACREGSEMFPALQGRHHLAFSPDLPFRVARVSHQEESALFLAGCDQETLDALSIAWRGSLLELKEACLLVF